MFDPECGTHWCEDCLVIGLTSEACYRDMRIVPHLCTKDRLVLQCKVCSYEEVYIREEKDEQG